MDDEPRQLVYKEGDWRGFSPDVTDEWVRDYCAKVFNWTGPLEIVHEVSIVKVRPKGEK